MIEFFNSLPVYTSALVSALLWALSAPILNEGITRIPKTQLASGLVVGLFAALSTGSLFLFAIQPSVLEISNFNAYIALAGVFTYLIGTGLYYASAHAFSGRTEYASQFAKIKPIFSVLLAMLVLNEIITSYSWVSLCLILMAVVILAKGADSGLFSWRAFVLGMLAALSWAIGEIFVKLGIEPESALQGTFFALASATLLLAPVAVIMIIKTPVLSYSRIWIVPFLGHGVLSFGIAYTAFFYSIAFLGMAQTVLINAFWPALAMLFGCGVAMLRKGKCKVHVSIWIAIALLMAGSGVQILGLK